MLRTRDGYTVAMPRFRVRRLRRRLGTRWNDLQRRASARLVGTLVGRAQRTSQESTRFPVFATHAGRQHLQIVTRETAPGRVELLYIRRRS